MLILGSVILKTLIVTLKKDKDATLIMISVIFLNIKEIKVYSFACMIDWFMTVHRIVL